MKKKSTLQLGDVIAIEALLNPSRKNVGYKRIIRTQDLFIRKGDFFFRV